LANEEGGKEEGYCFYFVYIDCINISSNILFRAREDFVFGKSDEVVGRILGSDKNIYPNSG